MTPTTTPPADPAAPPTPNGRPSDPPHAFDPALDPAPHRDLTLEEVERWVGKRIAWSWDGTTVVAVGDTYEELFRELDRAGIDPSRVVGDYVDDPNVSNL